VNEEIRILFAGGGTAGHLFPAINIAMEMKRMKGRVKPLFLGKKGGMEREIVERFGFEIREIEAIGMKRTVTGLLKFMLNWNKGYRQSLAVVREFDPVAVVGTGGYISAPAVRAGHRMNRWIFIQEQNSLPGLASRSVARYADMIFVAYESASRYLGKEKCLLTGNPIAPGMVGRDREESLREFDLDMDKKTLLIMGGSGGATGINKTASNLIAQNNIPSDWQVLWQTGKRDYDEYREKATRMRINGILMPFIEDMPAAYASADLVLSRAGAMALSEVTAVGLPSVLIPYPHATGDHQRLNAAFLGDAGAAIVISETEAEEKLPGVLAELFANETRRKEMSESALKSAKPNAASEISRTILDRINEVQKN
jgi:UDP-N-acetylglucosamine--N-acetylmuramyl-(pentapeptide) pyrophosphoryl-undecaprenol N-acetylglucosamine transferase